MNWPKHIQTDWECPCKAHSTGLKKEHPSAFCLSWSWPPGVCVEMGIGAVTQNQNTNFNHQNKEIGGGVVSCERKGQMTEWEHTAVTLALQKYLLTRWRTCRCSHLKHLVQTLVWCHLEGQLIPRSMWRCTPFQKGKNRGDAALKYSMGSWKEDIIWAVILRGKKLPSGPP